MPLGIIWITAHLGWQVFLLLLNGLLQLQLGYVYDCSAGSAAVCLGTAPASGSCRVAGQVCLLHSMPPDLLLAGSSLVLAASAEAPSHWLCICRQKQQLLCKGRTPRAESACAPAQLHNQIMAFMVPCPMYDRHEAVPPRYQCTAAVHIH